MTALLDYKEKQHYLCCMETKSILLPCLAAFLSAGLFAQSSHQSFNTIGEIKHKPMVGVMRECCEHDQEKPYVDSPKVVSDSLENALEDYSALSIEQLESLIAVYEETIKGKRARHTLTNKYNDEIISYYHGNIRELTLSNLVDMIEETGLTNQLFVLAQAVLETGNFSSVVCRKYNNLFGLYDSRKKDYYRFARWEDSVIGYQKMIQYRYKGGNYLQFLKRIGYAEDPHYTTKVAKLAVQLYDKMFND